jgi:vacuolar-type H+-ATPase subunit I/STV1
MNDLEITKDENIELKKSIKGFGIHIKKLKKSSSVSKNSCENDDEVLRIIKDNENLEAILDQKNSEINQLGSTYKNLLNAEREKVVKTKEKMIEARDKFDQKKNDLMQEMLEKDEQILHLTRKVRDISTNQTHISDSSRSNRPAELDNLSVAEYKLFRICQTMVDSASRIE